MYFTFSQLPVFSARSDQFVFNEWQSKLVVEAHLCWSRLQPHYSHPHYSFYMKHEVWALPVHMRWWMIYMRDYCVQILFTLGTHHMEFTRSSEATDETQHQRPPMALFFHILPASWVQQHVNCVTSIVGKIVKRVRITSTKRALCKEFLIKYSFANLDIGMKWKRKPSFSAHFSFGRARLFMTARWRLNSLRVFCNLESFTRFWVN